MSNFRIIFLAILLELGCVTSAYSEETILIGVSDWPPYLAQNLQYNGIAAQVIRESFASEGFKTELSFLPWKRAYKSAERGDLAGTFGWGWRADRVKHFYYSDNVFDSKQVFFHLKKYKFDWKSVVDLEGISIGGTIGYKYEKKFDDAEKAGKLYVDRALSDHHNFKKLVSGRIDIFPMEIAGGIEMLIREYGPGIMELVTYHPKPLVVEPIFLLISRKNKDNKRILESFNKGLRTLKSNGTYDQYFDDLY